MKIWVSLKISAASAKKKGLGLPGNFPRAWREKSETMWNFRNHQQYYQHRGQICGHFGTKGFVSRLKNCQPPRLQGRTWCRRDFVKWWRFRRIPSLKLTASLQLKLNGWNTIVSVWDGLFSGATVSFRECICQSDPVIQILVSEIRQPFAEVLGTRGPIHNATDQNRLNRFCESYRL